MDWTILLSGENPQRDHLAVLYTRCVSIPEAGLRFAAFLYWIRLLHGARADPVLASHGLEILAWRAPAQSVAQNACGGHLAHPPLIFSLVSAN
jgi:hypothetical protein